LTQKWGIRTAENKHKKYPRFHRGAYCEKKKQKNDGNLKKIGQGRAGASRA
jgi:hypothetical protein